MSNSKPTVPQDSKTKSEHWRNRIKNGDPDKYDDYKETERERARQYRQTLSEEQKERNRLLTRERVARHRAKKKKNKITSTEKVSTRKDTENKENQREKWCKEKRKQRAAMSSQKKRRVLEKRRNNYSTKKKLEVKIVLPRKKNETSTPECKTDTRSDEAKRKAVSRALKPLPKSPMKFASTLASIISSATPKRRKAAEEIGLVSSKRSLFQEKTIETVKNHLKHLRAVRSEKNLKSRRTMASSLQVLKKYGLMRTASKNLGITWKVINRKTIDRKKRSDTISVVVQRQVEKFYEDSSTYLACKKQVLVKSGFKPKKILDKTLKELYSKFTKVHPGIKLSQSKFEKMRPKHIRTSRETKLNQCLCEICTNIEHKLKVLNSFNQTILIPNKYELSSLTLCKFVNDHPHMKCVERKCGKCGTFKLDGLLECLGSRFEESCEWLKWVSETVTRNEPTGSVTKTSKKCLKPQKGILSDLIEELKLECESFSRHLFTAQWQSEQFKLIRDFPPRNTVIQVLDFAENYLCTFQDEAQAAHWNHELVTVHPTVCYYNCPDCSSVTTESLVFISDDLKHDYHAVHEFQLLSSNHLKYTRNLNIQHYIQWSDGCACQYKSKGPFIDMACIVDDVSTTGERNYFGSRHGKGPSDGESAVVKNAATRAVKSRQTIIKDAKAMYDYLNENLSIPKKPCSEKHYLRTIFWVPKSTINHDRPTRGGKRVMGTRNLHQVKCLKSGILSTRKFSCFCPFCLINQSQYCTNKDIVDDFKDEILKTLDMEPPATLDQSNIFDQDNILEHDTGYNLLEGWTLPTDMVNSDTMLEDEKLSPTSKTEYLPGQFVKVKLECGKSYKEYVAEIVEIKEDEVYIKYMESYNDFYYWPSVEDYSWEMMTSIIQKVDTPVFVAGRSTSRLQLFKV